MKEFILSIFGLDRESRKDLFTKEGLIFTFGLLSLFAIMGLIVGFVERI